MLIEPNHKGLSLVKQCGLLNVGRSGLYYSPVQESQENLAIMRTLDEQYLKTPFYGVERILVLLTVLGFSINRKRVRRPMKLMGWQTLYCAPRTTRIDPAAYKYPYLLRGLSIERGNQVWAIDITYLPMKNGSMYLCAIIDIHTRYNIFIERLWRTVKYEHVYLHAYEDGLTLYKGLNEYFKFYNDERRHQSLDYETPLTMYQPA